jgi:hypothetical protein
MATVTDYHGMILNLEKEYGRSPTIQEVANALRLNPDDKNVSHKIQMVKDIISNAKEEMRIAEKNLTSDRNSSLGIEPQAPPNNPFNFGGKKSRRHAKKSRRHAKKSRRHAKKSRRHAKKSRN